MQTSMLNELSAVEIRQALTRREITCEEIARACIARVLARDGEVKAWIHFDSQQVLAQARRLDSCDMQGPLHGIPIGIKDIFDTYDMPTQMGSPIYRGHRPVADASCVAILRAAGALIFGKTITCEFAGTTPAQTANPHDLARTPGGSSSGSAAAVADKMVPLALGTQTGGSILRPASFCGIVGYKPTFGLISTVGVKPAAESLDTVGLFARTVEDIELAASVLTSSDPPLGPKLGTPVRVGFCRTPSWDSTEPPTRDALSATAMTLESHGHQIREIQLPCAFDELVNTREIVNDYERARAMAHEWNLHRDQLSGGLTDSIRRGIGCSAARYMDAMQRVQRLQNHLPSLFSEVDVLLAPTVPGEAPIGLAYTGDHRLQSIWTQLRTPTVNLPVHTGPNGMPVGVQLVGLPYGDRNLLAIARIFLSILRREAPAKAGAASAPHD